MTGKSVHLHWGDGRVAEEVRVPTRYHVAVVQLIDMEDGTQLVRFCWYDHAGRFHRQPLIVDPATWGEVLAQARSEAPRLYRVLVPTAEASASSEAGGIP
jgi:hypothetical protein